jgi:hypothetical protein
MAQTCTKCSRANPPDAVYCYFDGFVLGGGQGRNGGPVAVGSQRFVSPFVFPNGHTCRSFNELALACQAEWNAARDLLLQGYLETFLGGLGRLDLAQAAREAARFPDHDRGLDQLLATLPSDVLADPKLRVETTEINLGILSLGTERRFEVHLENQGMRLLHGTVSCGDCAWLTLGDGPGTTEKHFQTGHELSIPVRVCGDRLRAHGKPQEAKLLVETNGGRSTIAVKCEVPVKPYPPGLLGGARSPRQVAEKAKANPKEAAPLFERGDVAAWYKDNGWTYPVRGPAASGLGAVQQFFEALGLTPPPKVEISERSVKLAGNPGEQLRHVLEVKTQEKRPVYAHGTSNQPWLEVSRAKLSGRVATIALRVPSVPDRPGEALKAQVVVQSNGNQRFVVPVTLRVGVTFDFSAPAPLEAVEVVEPVEVIEPVEAVPLMAVAAPAAVDAAPLMAVEAVPPLVTARGGRRPPSQPVAAVPPQSSLEELTATAPAFAAFLPSSRLRGRRAKGKPFWMHAVPAVLLALAVLGVVLIDLVKGGPSVAGADDRPPPDPKEPTGWTYKVRDNEPLLGVQFSDQMRFGLVMEKEFDPRPALADRKKRLTFEELGLSNNTIVKISNYEYWFGAETPTNRWVTDRKGKSRKKVKIENRLGWLSEMDFTRDKVRVTQHVEIVPGDSGMLDTCLVYYTIVNYGEVSKKVGIRFLMDTYIGANDGVPFTIPGEKGFLDTMRDFPQKDVPDYIEVIENPDDPKDHGTVVRMGLKNIKLPGVDLEDVELLRICRWPGNRQAQWDWKPLPMNEPADNKDSCVVLYWPYLNMNPGDERRMAFTYGLGKLDVGGLSGAGGTSLALSTPASVQPGKEFVVTAYVWGARKGDKVKLELPRGLGLVSGEELEQTVEEEAARTQVFWKVKAGEAGTYTIEAASGKARARPREVVVKVLSIFG